MARILVTGAAGFIGYHVASKILDGQNEIVLIDNMNSYYDVELKKARLKKLEEKSKHFKFHNIDIADEDELLHRYEQLNPDVVIHLAAQAGVRYSIDSPFVYGRSNLTGFLNILELCRQFKVPELIYASSSSVYGMADQYPSVEWNDTDQPISLYAATKKANEVMASSYGHLYGIRITGLRFFTVYGPWGRPDMALFKFTKAILNDEPIQVFGGGEMSRDFTYIDDIVSGVIKVLNQPGVKGHTIYNLGNGNPTKLMQFISLIERELGKTAKIEYLPMQAGDVIRTYADIGRARFNLGYEPKESIESGVKKFVEWYREYYKV